VITSHVTASKDLQTRSAVLSLRWLTHPLSMTSQHREQPSELMSLPEMRLRHALRTKIDEALIRSPLPRTSIFPIYPDDFIRYSLAVLSAEGIVFLFQIPAFHHHNVVVKKTANVVPALNIP
jgi:hypothetical protein